MYRGQHQQYQSQQMANMGSMPVNQYQQQSTSQSSSQPQQLQEHQQQQQSPPGQQQYSASPHSPRTTSVDRQSQGPASAFNKQDGSANLVNMLSHAVSYSQL